VSIEPVDPSKKSGGEGNEKYNPNQKRGPGLFDEVLEKAKSDRKPSGGGGGGGGAGIPKVGPRRPTDMKKGGAVSSASKRADGCAVKGKTKGKVL
jgi:hypothetical protein